MEYFDDNMKELVYDFFDDFKYASLERRIACFSEVNDSQLMWAHYANNHKGMVFEYETEDIIKFHGKIEKEPELIGECELYHLVPVIYSKNRYDASNYFIKKFVDLILKNSVLPINEITNVDELLFIKSTFYKASDWKYENEWRIFTEKTNSNESVCISKNIKVKKVYVGAKMSKKNITRIVNICKQKKIGCYKMSCSIVSGEYKMYVTPEPLVEF